MKKQLSLRVMALAGVCLVPMAVAAQGFDQSGDSSAQASDYNNWVDVGVRYQSGTSPLFGRYTGHDSRGFGSLGAFHLQGGDDPKSGGTYYFEADGRNLDFQLDHQGPNNALAPESEVNVTAGQRGTWKVNAFYDAITYTGQTFYSPYTSSGALAPGLQAFGGYDGVTSGSGHNLNYYATHTLPMLKETAGTRRDIGGVDGKYLIGNWVISSDFRHEHKEGTKLQTLEGSAAGTAFPEPVDYDTNLFGIQGEYNTERLQALLRYDYSQFTDNTSAFVAPFFASDNNGEPTRNEGQFTSVYSLPPSNDAHYVSGMAAYSLTRATQVNTDFRYGLESSNVSLPAITATPLSQLYQYGGMILNPSGSTTHQMARVYNGDVSINSRSIPKLDLKATYAIEGREVGSNPLSLYGAGYFEAASNSIWYNQYHTKNQNWTKQKVAMEAGYHVLDSTKVTVGYAYDDVRRDAGVTATTGASAGGAIGYWVGHSSENTASMKVSNTSIAKLTNSVAYEHGVRTGTYEYVANSLLSGAFYQTPRTSDRVKLRSNYRASREWSVGLNGQLEENHYHYLNGQTGTNRDSNASIGPDVTYSPTQSVDLHGFYTYERIYYDNGGNGMAKYSTGQGWDVNTTDSIHSAGAALIWKATDRLKFDTEYTFSYGDIGYNMFGGITSTTTTQSYQNVENLPNVSSSMHSLKVRGEYQLTPAISFMAGYGFDLYKDNDWSYGWDPVVLSSGSVSSLSSGESRSSYRVHSLYTSMRVKF
ncbi:MtrB/PioB family outer membrane beta-barrel protein [Telmatospirillum siberiense]|nr:MtrB/PioB family outer membrane beta-barrel protein [Telmatospirillum siberiense]